MNRRNLTTAAIAVSAVLLLYTGVSMAREPERAPLVDGFVPRATQAADDHGGDRGQVAGPTLADRDAGASATPDVAGAGDDHDVDAAGTAEPGDDGTAGMSASPTADDRGNDARETGPLDDRGAAAGPSTNPTASADDRADDRGNDAASPTPRLSSAPTSPAPTAGATADDHSHDGGGHR